MKLNSFRKLATLALTVVFAAGTVIAEDKDMMKKDHIMMKDGKMMVMKDGKSMMMEKDMTTTDGTKVMQDGTVMMKDGKKMMMKDGDMMMMDGKMMKGEMKK